MTVSERFWIKVEKTDGCWNWVGSISNTGYGQFRIQTFKMVLAHRLSYEMQNGSIQEGLVIDHLCRNRRCVNPRHLEAVTRSENMRRGVSFNKHKTHCPKGHQYTKANTYKYTTQGRKCRTCASVYKRSRSKHALLGI